MGYRGPRGTQQVLDPGAAVALCPWDPIAAEAWGPARCLTLWGDGSADREGRQQAEWMYRGDGRGLGTRQVEGAGMAWGYLAASCREGQGVELAVTCFRCCWLQVRHWAGDMSALEM